MIDRYKLIMMSPDLATRVSSFINKSGNTSVALGSAVVAEFTENYNNNQLAEVTSKFGGYTDHLTVYDHKMLDDVYESKI